MTPCCWRAARSSRAIWPCRAASSTASISPWISCRSRTAAFRRSRWAMSSPSAPSGKHVVVIGGGDTGSDCIGTSFRQGALSVTQLEIMPQPPEKENKALTWPHWPLKLRTSSSQAEGAERDFAVMTTHFPGDRQGQHLAWNRVDEQMKPIEGSEFDLPPTSSCWPWALCTRSRRA